MKPNRLAVFALLLALALVLFACGSLGDIFGGQKNLPNRGVTPWGKIDLFSEFELVQPFVLLSEQGEEYLEPCLLKIDGAYRMYFEIARFAQVDGTWLHERSAIYLAESSDGLDWIILHDQQAVLVADQPWEGDFVGAPAVVKTSEGYRMYYGGNRGGGIGLAISDDGEVWKKEESGPVVVPDQNWEGGTYGQVLSPSVAIEDGVVHMWYAGGVAGHAALDHLMGSAIGYARSQDGLTFVKMDGRNRTSGQYPGSVRPVFSAEKAWEGADLETNEGGAVGMPAVLVDTSADRTVYRLYYTGHRIGDMYSDNASIGYAGSFDRVNFVRADDLLNPVVTETFVLSVPGISELLDFDEFSGSVIRDDAYQYLMAFSQIDAMSWLGYGLKGIGMAACPPLP